MDVNLQYAGFSILQVLVLINLLGGCSDSAKDGSCLSVGQRVSLQSVPSSVNLHKIGLGAREGQLVQL